MLTAAPKEEQSEEDVYLEYASEDIWCGGPVLEGHGDPPLHPPRDHLGTGQKVLQHGQMLLLICHYILLIPEPQNPLLRKEDWKGVAGRGQDPLALPSRLTPDPCWGNRPGLLLSARGVGVGAGTAEGPKETIPRVLPWGDHGSPLEHPGGQRGLEE